MNTQPAIRGLLVSATHDLADNGMTLLVKVDRLAYAAFAPTAGVPEAAAGWGGMPSVMLISCATPRWPETDRDVMEAAAFAFLDDDLRSRTEPPTQPLLDRMRGLIATLGEALLAVDAAQDERPTP